MRYRLPKKDPSKIQDLGFTLIEVLIGLAILAIALASGMKGLSQTVQSQIVIQQQYLAVTSANNILNTLYLQRVWPELSPEKTNCSQLNTQLVCIRSAFVTPNPLFRRVQIEVFESQRENPLEPRGQRLAKLTTILFNYQLGTL
jgi:general secretion pathway protein I